MSSITVFKGIDLRDGDITGFFKSFLETEISSKYRSDLPRNTTLGMDEYNFTHDFRGIAIVISNEKFDKLDSRPYADDELRKMNTVFSALGFIVMLFKNLTAEQIYKVLETASSSELNFFHSKSDCFACVLASHGKEVEEHQATNPNMKIFHHVIYGTDKGIPTHRLLDLFDHKSCRSLRGRPKLFFIQACRNRFDEEDHRGFDVGVDVPVKIISTKNSEINNIREGSEDNSILTHSQSDVLNRTENIAEFGGDDTQLPDITCSGSGENVNRGHESLVDPTVEADDNVRMERTLHTDRNDIHGSDVEFIYEKDTAEKFSGIQRGVDWIKKNVSTSLRRHLLSSLEVVATPCHNDCLVMYSTPQDKVSFGRSGDGGWMLSGLFQVMKKYLGVIRKDDQNCTDFLSLMTRVMQTVAFQMQTSNDDPKMSGLKIVPTLQHKFCKDVIFRNKFKQ